MATPLSSPIVRDGDTSFLGLQSRRNPLTIKEGYLQSAQNVRLDRGIAQTRRGAQKLAAGISAAGLAVTVPVDLIDLTLSSLTQSGGTATATTASAHGLLTGYKVVISGASPSAYNGNVVITVTSPTTFTYSVANGTASPATGTINTGYPVIESSYEGGIYGAGIYSSPRLDNGNEYILLAGTNAVYLWKDGTVLATKSYPTSPISEKVAQGDLVNIVQAFDSVFLFRWRASDQPQTVSSISLPATPSTTCTITTAAEHGYSTGEVVRLSGSSVSAFNLDAVITVGSTTTFTITLPASATALSDTASALFAQRVCCPLVWDGGTGGFVRVTTGANPLGPTYSYLVAPVDGIACYFNNQLAIANSKDGILVSDVLNPNNFDPLQKSFRTNQGSNDHLVAIHPYADGTVIVFLRKSIYLGKIWLAADGISIDPSTSYLQLLTTEIGCNARQTVATAGNYVFFLSDAGVYRLDNSQIDLALRGNSLPLSEPIADLVSKINSKYVYLSQGIYFNNRYYLAVPINEATFPNCLLIYNNLNEAWESQDIYPFSIDALVISDYGSQRRLFAASSGGLLYLLESYDSGVDDPSSGSVPIPVQGSITTRRYFYGQLNRKRLGNVAVSASLPSGSTVDVSAVATDPDNETHVATVTNPATSQDNDFTIRAPIRRTATYLDLKITTSSGRPTIRAVSADATLPSDTSRLARTES